MAAELSRAEASVAIACAAVAVNGTSRWPSCSTASARSAAGTAPASVCSDHQPRAS